MPASDLRPRSGDVDSLEDLKVALENADISVFTQDQVDQFYEAAAPGNGSDALQRLDHQVRVIVKNRKLNMEQAMALVQESLAKACKKEACPVEAYEKFCHVRQTVAATVVDAYGRKAVPEEAKEAKETKGAKEAKETEDKSRSNKKKDQPSKESSTSAWKFVRVVAAQKEANRPTEPVVPAAGQQKEDRRRSDKTPWSSLQRKAKGPELPLCLWCL